MLGFNVAFINVDGIAESLKSVEAYAYRKREFRNGKIKSGEEIEVFYKESAVFENSEKAKIENQRRNKRKFCADTVSVLFNYKTMEIVDGCAENKKGHPNRFAPCIEKERKENQHGVSESSVFRSEIEQKIYRQEKIEEK